MIPKPAPSSLSVPPVRSTRRRFLRAGPVLAAALAGPSLPAGAQGGSGEHWCATWGTTPAGPPPVGSTQDYSGRTLRLIVRTSVGGGRVRIRVSNEMGGAPLRIGRAAVGLRTSGAGASSLRELRFGGQAAITIPAGAPALSDALALAVPPQTDLAVSLFLPGSAPGSTIHNAAFQTGYVSPAGDHAGLSIMPVARAIASWPFLTEVDVDAAAPAIVVLGDSLTDGMGSTSNANRRWPDYLARRLQGALGSGGMGVVNRGICANLLLNDYPGAQLAGRDTLERFDRDVLATTGVRYLVALIGINDICYSPGSNPIPASELIAGYRQLIARAHAHDIAMIGATLPPFAGFVYFTNAREAVRRAANDWIRTSGEFDAVADVELALRDPSDPTRLLPAYDSGDHLHPNDGGHQAIANCMPLAAFLAGDTGHFVPA